MHLTWDILLFTRIRDDGGCSVSKIRMVLFLQMNSLEQLLHLRQGMPPTVSPLVLCLLQFMAR